MKNRIPVSIEDYKNYLNKYGTNRLDSKNEIYCVGSFPPKFYREQHNINEEIFEGIPCNYEILEKTNNQVLIKFKSKSHYEYRLDIFKEINNDIWHIAFSEFDNSITDMNNYEVLTDKKESIDVFSRLVWILKDLDMNVEYCIGATGDLKKDRIYQYMMRFVSNWEKRDNNDYPLGWGIYFTI